MARRSSLVLAALLSAACDKSVNLQGRACVSTVDCLSGYVCSQQVCVEKRPLPPDPTEDDIIASLDPGVTFIVDAGVAVQNVPIYVPLDPDHLDASRVLDGGSNVRFVDVAAHHLIPAEIVRFDSSGVSETWLSFANLDGPVTVELGYGTAGVPALEENGWSSTSFAGVWHFDSSADASNVVGPLNTEPTHTTGSLGDAFAPATAETTATPRNQGDAMTLELLVKPRPNSWTLKRTLTTDGTTIAGQQVMWTAPVSGGRRVLDSDGSEVALWTEFSSKTLDTFWTRLPTAGTTTLTTYEGPGGAHPESGLTSVLDSGLWMSLWYNTTTGVSPVDTASMNARFDGFSYTSAALSTRQTVPLSFSGDCENGSETGSNCRFGFLFEGWVVPPAGTVYFSTASDDASDVIIGGDTWKTRDAGNVAAATSYGQHGVPSPPPAAARGFVFNGDAKRYQYRMTQGGGGWQVRALAGSVAALSSNSVMPVSWCYYRTRVGEDPVTTYSDPLLLGDVLHEAADLALIAAPGGAQVKVGDAVLTSGPLTNWTLLTVAYDGASASLYRDGVLADTKPVTTPLVRGTRTLSVGDQLGDPLSESVSIDELRFSTVMRSPDWISVQARNVRGELVTFE